MSFTTARFRKTASPCHLLIFLGSFLTYTTPLKKETTTSTVLTSPIALNNKKETHTNPNGALSFSGRSFKFQAILLKRLCGRSISTGFRLSNLKPVVDPQLAYMLMKLSFEPTTPWTPVTVGDVSLPISQPRSRKKIYHEIS